MGKKRSSRMRRREPIRHPIPQARLRAAPPQHEVAHLTESDLVDGWSPLPHVRIRQARAEDIDAVTALSRLAGVEIEAEVMDAVRAGMAGTEVRAGLRDGGKDGFLRAMAGKFVEYQGGDQRQLFAHVALVLIAEHDEQGVVGALVAYPPVGVVGQMLEHNQRVGGGGQQAMQILMMGVMAICRVKSLAVAPQARGHGIGAALLGYCHQVYEHLGYMIIYGQAPTKPGLDMFYRRRGFEVLDVGVGFDPWVVFGVHADIRPDPQEQIFIWNRPSGRPDRRQLIPGPRRPAEASASGRYDPGILALHEDRLAALLRQETPADVLVIHLPAYLWVKLAEGNPANACVSACMTLHHAYAQLGIATDVVPTGLIIHDASGQRTQFATDRPYWHSETELVGHTVLLLPEHDRLVDPTVEQIPPIRALGLGPVVGRVPAEGRHALRQGGASFAVPRQDLLIEYTPVQRNCRDILTQAPRRAVHAPEYRRSGVNLATLVLGMLRAPWVVDRIRAADFPRIHALLDLIGDAPMEPDVDKDMRITLSQGAPAVRLDELPVGQN